MKNRTLISQINSASSYTIPQQWECTNFTLAKKRKGKREIFLSMHQIGQLLTLESIGDNEVKGNFQISDGARFQCCNGLNILVNQKSKHSCKSCLLIQVQANKHQE